MMGFVVRHIGVKWIFWILAIINLCQFLGYLLFGGETIYSAARDARVDAGASEIKRRWFPFSKSGSTGGTPLIFWTFCTPFQLVSKASVIIPTWAYAVVFCYANIAILVEMPAIFGEKFHLNAQQIGLQYIALLIGSIIGEQVLGPLSDLLQRRREQALQRQHQGHVSPTHLP
jgi:hypothetical protein